MVRHSVGETTTVQVESITVADLPPGEVLIKVVYSSLNYKDALATQAHPGVVNQLPHVPGIDCAGTVVESSVADFAVDDSVLVTGYDLGAPAWGGFSRFVRVPSEWVVRLPAVLSPRQAMIYGTAGFTAAQSVRAICHHGILPTGGEVVVTGATGGVGSVAVALLAKLGYTVVAVTGKPELHGALTELGAARILSRQEVSDTTGKPLLSPRWAAAVDTVGGNVLATICDMTIASEKAIFGQVGPKVGSVDPGFGGQARLGVQPQRRLERRDHVAHHIFRRIMQQRHQPRWPVQFPVNVAGDPLDQNAVLRHGKGVVALGLAIPPRHPRKAMGDILDLDVERRGVQQVESPSRKHPLPGAKFRCHVSAPVSSPPHGGGSRSCGHSPTRRPA